MNSTSLLSRAARVTRPTLPSRPRAGITDPGVAGRQNQDDFFLWESPDGKTVIVGIFDGHGRELGQVRGRSSFCRTPAAPAPP